MAYVAALANSIGLGVSIDYSLMFVSRFREELALGSSRRKLLQGPWSPPVARSLSLVWGSKMTSRNKAVR